MRGLDLVHGRGPVGQPAISGGGTGRSQNVQPRASSSGAKRDSQSWSYQGPSPVRSVYRSAPSAAKGSAAPQPRRSPANQAGTVSLFPPSPWRARRHIDSLRVASAFRAPSLRPGGRLGVAAPGSAGYFTLTAAQAAATAVDSGLPAP